MIESTTFIDGYISAFINAQMIAEMAIGVLGFWLGTGYSVELIQVLEGDEATPRVLGVRPTDETTGKSLGFEGPILERALKLAKRDAFFRLAVNDYVRAIPALLDCPTYCNRAIEAIKSSFDNKAGGDDWQLMHCALGPTRTRS